MELVGREPEITALRAAYATVADSASSATLSVRGPSGYGKTALLRDLEAFAEPKALVLHTAAHPFDRFIPFAIARRLAPDLHERLERETRERPVIVAIDDAHFADEESLRDIAASASAPAQRPLLCLFAFDDEQGALPIASDATITLRELNERAALALAERCYSDAPRAVLDAIVARAQGIPYEIVVLASAAGRRAARNADEVPFSSRAAIAKELAGRPAPERMVLQLLSLLPEPLDLSLLEADVPDFPHLGHTLTTAAIAETIAMKIPLRRRIISALERRGLRDVRDRVMLADQLLTSGDGVRLRGALLDVALLAKSERLSRVVICASEHHLEHGEPPDERFVEFYGNFFEALMETGDHARAEAVAAHALSEAQHRGISPLGELAAHLVQAQWMVDRHDAARASYERYARAFDDPRDVQILNDAAPWHTS
ncbi:MAG: ATP-binding protein [Candidatus Aquilonibacter sp.]|jgi:hypothetical protein